jgi:hypothetical protein
MHAVYCQAYPMVMEKLYGYVYIIFGLTTLLTVYLFYKASGKSNSTLVVLVVWLLFQALMGLAGFYLITDTVPPRFPLLIVPPLLFIIVLFLTPSGKAYIDGLDLRTLTILHIIRVPVELVLFWLFVHKAIPELMTFEGRNFDILSGITAPIMYYLGFTNNKPKAGVLIAWNIVCLGLLINIVVNAALSVPSPIQQFAFDQPNVGILFFPFNWLPACVVPLVLLSHLASLRQLLLKKSASKA